MRHITVFVFVVLALAGLVGRAEADCSVTAFTSANPSVQSGQSVNATVTVNSTIFSGTGQVTFTTTNASLANAPASLNIPANFDGSLPIVITTNGGVLNRAGSVTIRAQGDLGVSVPLVITIRPTCDSCSRAFTVGNGASSFTTVNATTDGFSDFCGSAQQDIWLRYTATCTGILNINVTTAGFPVRLHTYNTNCPGGNNQSIGCVSSASNVLNTSRFVSVGNSLIFRIGSTVTGAAGTGAGTFTINCVVPNDNCADAQEVFSGQTVNTNTQGASQDGTGCATNSRDVWYRFTAPVAGRLHVDTCGTETASGFESGLGLYSGCPGNAGSLLACNDDHGLVSCIGPGTPNDAAIERNLAQNEQVFIRVNGNASTGGSNIIMHVLFTPGNDVCANAIDVSSGGSFIGTLTGANGNGASSCAPPVNSPDVWYKFTATCPGILTVNTCGSHDIFGQNEGSNTALSLHGSCGGGAVELACNDNPAPGQDPCGNNDNGTLQDAFLTHAILAAQTVFIRVSSPGGFGTGPFFLNVSFASTGVPNDICADAIVVGLGNTPFCTEGASTSGTVATCGGGRHDVFFRYTPDCPAEVVISVCAVNFDSSIAVYDQLNCPPDAALEVACDLDSCAPGATVTFDTIEGHSYLIRIGGNTAADEGSGVMSISRRCICPCDWNQDFQLDSQDLFDFLTDFFNGDADYNLDMIFDSQDFFDYIECFFNAPPFCNNR